MANVSNSNRQFRRGVDRFLGGFTSVTGFVSGAASIWIFCLMLLICADIFGRTIFHAPVQGVSEIVANSIVAIVFLQAAHTLMSGRMTRTDILIGKLEEGRPFAAALIRIAFHLGGIFVFATIATGTLPKLVDAWAENEFFGAQGVFTAPVWPIKACLFGGSVLTAIAFAAQALKDIKEVVNDGRVEPLTVRHTTLWINGLCGQGNNIRQVDNPRGYLHRHLPLRCNDDPGDTDSRFLPIS